MTRPSEQTRKALLDAAIEIFAEKGFAHGSVRDITRRAKANQAAINYHFGSKDGLYREVLKTAVAALDRESLIDEADIDRLEPAEALAAFLREQLTPLRNKGRFGRYLRIFAWESVTRTPVFQDFVTTEPLRVIALARKLTCRLLPEAAAQTDIDIASFWLVNQAFMVVRNFDYLASPPFNLANDETSLDRLVEQVCRLVSHGIGRAAAAEPSGGHPA